MRNKLFIFLSFFLSFFLSGALYADSFAYVVNNAGNNVIPFDLSTNTFGTPIRVGAQPVYIAFTPDGTAAYVVNQFDNSVCQIDIADTNTVLQTISVGELPVGIAITPNGKTAYVCNFLSSNITTIDTISNDTNTLQLPDNSNPSEIAFTPNGKTAYITLTSGPSGNTVLPLDIASGTFGTNIPVGPSPMGIVITTDGQVAYVANNGTPSVTPISLSNNTPGTAITISSSGFAPFDVAITSDNATVYVTNSNGRSMVAIDTGTNIAGNPSPLNTFISKGIAISDDSTGYVAASGGSVDLFHVSNNTYFLSVPGPSPSGFWGIRIAPADRGRLTPAPFPANNLSGRQKNNRFAFQSELYNILTWSPSASKDVVSYNVYGNDILIGNVSATDNLEFEDHNQKKGVETVYKVTALFGDGSESKAVAVTVP